MVKCFQISPPSPQPRYLKLQLLQSMSNKSSSLDCIPDIAPEIMCRHFLHPHLALGKPLFHPGHFSYKFKLELISPLLKKPGLLKLDLANFRPISNLNTIGKILAFYLYSFFLTFQNLPVNLLYSLLIVNFILLRLLYLNSQMISWKPLTPEKLQFSVQRLQPLILWT